MCPFCNSDRASKTDEDYVEEITKQVDVNDTGAINLFGSWYLYGVRGLQQELPKAVELMAKAADLVPDGRISAWVTFMMKEGI